MVLFFLQIFYTIPRIYKKSSKFSFFVSKIYSICIHHSCPTF